MNIHEPGQTIGVLFMKSYELDIAIIGGGCIGSSILYEFCRRGYKNIGLIDHGRKKLSATAHSGGMLRVFHEHPAHISLSLGNLAFIEAYRRQGVLKAELITNGNLYFFNKNRYSSYKKNLLNMDKANYPYEIFTPKEGEKHFPQFHWAEDWAIYEPTAGRLSPNQLIEDLREASKSYGAKLYDEFEVQHIIPMNDQFRLMNHASMITTKRLILAGGARLVSRFKDLALKIPFEIKTLTTFLAKKLETNEPLPNFFDREILSFGCFSQSTHTVLSHKQCNRVIKEQWAARFEHRSAEDVYINNRLGRLGPVENHQGLYIATGWGGTAFKFALEIGYRMVNAFEDEVRGV